MFENITITGFKTFAHNTVIGLKGLSVLAGKNSAGKSTIIQSMAALKQSIEEPTASGLELNGRYVRLGGFKDALARGAENPFFEIGFQASTARGLGTICYRFAEESGRPITTKISYSNDTDDRCYTARDLPASVRVILGRLGLQHALASEQEPGVWMALAGLVPRWVISLAPSNDVISRQEHLRERAHTEIIEIVKLLLERTTASGAPARAAIGGLEKGIESGSLYAICDSLESLLDTSDLSREGTLTNELLNEDDSYALVRESLTAQQILALERLFLFAETELDVVAAWESLVVDAIALPHNGYSVREELGDDAISAFLKNVFAGLLYLGPLRRPPMLSYADKPDALSKVLPDGMGLMAHLKSRWHESSDFGTPSAVVEAALTVGDCVNHWCRYLGISEGLEISGGSGVDYEVKFEPLKGRQTSELERPLDLPTNVGVGVTQLLPIIGLLIVAGRNSTCLLEQPELHLHPSAQTKLAELFVAAVNSGRQLIIETHSEHLINGIRVAVASRVLDPGQIEMMFVSSDAVGSNIQRVEIDSRGLIENWPVGFFDEAERGAVKLLSAALKAGKNS